jgi:hypothetical protein
MIVGKRTSAPHQAIGWIGLTIIFASFALIGVVWFVMRMVRPPLMYALTRSVK